MKRLVLSTLVFAAACADICERGETLSRTFPERHAACFAEGTLPGAAFDTKACDTSMNVCSSTDVTKLHAYFDCVEQLPACTRAKQMEFTEKYLGCSKDMLQVTEGCFRP